MTEQDMVYRSGQSLYSQMEQTIVPEDVLALWHLGQLSLAAKGGGKICYFDPYLSNYIYEVSDPGGKWNRRFPTPLQPEQIAHADYVFISHDHSDHMDPVSLRGIADKSPTSMFICPAPIVSSVAGCGVDPSRIIAARAEEVLQLDGIQVMPIACKHEEFLLDEHGNHAYLGYVLDWNGISLYFAGDTIGFPELAEKVKSHRIDIACMPINGQDWLRSSQGIAGNMNHREALDLAHAIKADMLIPMHYDLFPGNAENPAYFVDDLLHRYPKQKFKMMAVGERFMYYKEY